MLTSQDTIFEMNCLKESLAVRLRGVGFTGNECREVSISGLPVKAIEPVADFFVEVTFCRERVVLNVVAFREFVDSGAAKTLIQIETNSLTGLVCKGWIPSTEMTFTKDSTGFSTNAGCKAASCEQEYDCVTMGSECN
ncbi:hypothetical protein BBD46_17210 [Natrialba sp. SSL1]|nr:hypothetical protein BBD46_17210 [Natrialba sp. SSL1]